MSTTTIAPSAHINRLIQELGSALSELTTSLELVQQTLVQQTHVLLAQQQQQQITAEDIAKRTSALQEAHRHFKEQLQRIVELRANHLADVTPASRVDPTKLYTVIKEAITKIVDQHAPGWSLATSTSIYKILDEILKASSHAVLELLQS